MKKEFSWIIYKILVFLAMMGSFQAWFTWNVHFLLGISLLCYGLAMFLTKKELFKIGYNGVWFSLIFLTVISGAFSSGLLAIVGEIIGILPVFFIITLKPYYKMDMFMAFRKYFSIFLAISFVGWLLYILGIQTPYEMIDYGPYDNGKSQYLYENHYLFLVNVTRLETILFPRFCSVFIEPGYLGCLMAMMLYIGEYKMNKHNAIFYVSLLATFSLAGYLLLIIGAFLYFSKKSGNPIKWVLILGSFILFIICSIRFYNNGNNYLNEILLARVNYDKNNGFEGNTRSNYELDRAFKPFIGSTDIFWGLGDNLRIDLGHGVDMRAYIIKHGMVSLVFFVVFLFYPCFKEKRNFNCFVLSLLYFLIFSQTIFLSMSIMYLTLFFAGINIHSRRIA